MSSKRNKPAHRGKREPDGRYVAYLVLLDVLERNAWAQFSLRKLTGQYQLPPRERQMTSALVYKTLEQYPGLKYRLERRVKRGWQKLDPQVRVAMLLGLSQILYFSRIPDSAAVNEAVNIVRGAGKGSAGGFVNGVLRGLIRDPVHLPKNRPDLHYGVSPWLWDRLDETLGEEEARSFLATVNKPEPLSIRINRIKIRDAATEHKLLKRIEDNGFAIKPSGLVPDMYRLEGSGSQLLTDLPGWDAGHFTIQGEGAALAAYLLQPEPGMRVLDACAAPGGKTALIAQLMANEGELLAADLQPHRIDVMKRTLDRLGARAQTIEADAILLGTPKSPAVFQKHGQFDRVLTDVPCSNWGNLGSKPELRWRGNDDDLRDMEQTAEKILDAAAIMVKPGGRLVYSTCTLNKGENEQLVERFIERSGGAWHFPKENVLSLEDTPEINLNNNDRIGRKLESGQITLLPQHEGVPGFYIAVLERRSAQS